MTPHDPASPTPIRSTRTPEGLFASVRSSRDTALAAFAVGLLLAFAAHAGAFVTRLSAPGTPAARAAQAPTTVARRAPPQPQPQPAAVVPAAVEVAPCAAPRS